MSGGWQSGQSGDEQNPYGRRAEPVQYSLDPQYQPQQDSQPQYQQDPQYQPQQYRPDQQDPQYQQEPQYQFGSQGQAAPQYGPGVPYPPGPQQFQQSAPRGSKAPLIITLVAVLVVVLCGGGAIGAYAIYRHGGSSPSSSATAPPNGKTYPVGASGMGKGWEVGNLGSDKKIEIFEDFACSYCKKAHDAIQPAIDDLIAGSDNEWDIVYYPVGITGAPAKRAANAFACTGTVDAATQRDALDYQAAMFAHQPPGESAGFVAGDLIDLAPAVFRGDGTFVKCVRSNWYTDWVNSLWGTASERKVTGTPTVFVDGKKLDQADVTADGFAAALAG